MYILVGGSDESELDFQSLSASWWGQVAGENVRGSKARAIEEVPAVEAKKAEGASMVTLLIPSPPRWTGNGA